MSKHCNTSISLLAVMSLNLSPAIALHHTLHKSEVHTLTHTHIHTHAEAHTSLTVPVGLMMRSRAERDCDEGETNRAWRRMTDGSSHSIKPV